MKKLTALILILLGMVCAAYCEEMPIESMSLEELFTLRAAIDSRIFELSGAELDSSTIYEGVYIVGKDIAPGRYLMTCNKETDDQFDEDFAYYLYQNEDDYRSYRLLHSDSVSVNGSLSVTLEDCMVFYVVQGQAVVQSLTKPSWAP